MGTLKQGQCFSKLIRFVLIYMDVYMQQNTIGVLIFASVECLIYQKHDGN